MKVDNHLYSLLIDGGSSKMDIILLRDSMPVHRYHIQGFNPLSSPREYITGLFTSLQNMLTPHVASNISEVNYFGAGCGSQAVIAELSHIINIAFPNAQITIDSDMTLAARILLGHSSGVACILGTGANTTFSNGHTLSNLSPSLGYMLGDEGSGAYMGKKILATYLRGELHKSAARLLATHTDYATKEIIFQNIYHNPTPARYMAATVKIINEALAAADPNAHQAFCNEIVIPSFHDFFSIQLSPYSPITRKVAFCGSIASSFAEPLRATASQHGWCVTTIIKAPLDTFFQKDTNPTK